MKNEDGINLNSQLSNETPTANNNVFFNQDNVIATGTAPASKLVKDSKLQKAAKFVCPNCGFGLSENAAVCMHCGSTVTDITGAVTKDNVVYERVKKRKFKPIIITNIILTALMVIGTIILSTLASGALPIDLMLYIPLLIAIYVNVMFYMTCYQMLLHKAYLPWWGAYIPIYNFFEFYDLTTGSPFYFLWNIFPAGIAWWAESVGSLPLLIASLALELVIGIVMWCKFANRFGASQILTILFPAIYIPIVSIAPKYNIGV